MTSRRRGILYLAGALIVVAPPAIWMLSSFPPSVTSAAVSLPRPIVETVDVALAAHLEAASRDPMSLVQRGLERYTRTVREYRCLLTKQERLGRKLSEVQEIEVRYREEPRAIYMLWRKNPAKARRALFMEGPEYVNDKGEKLVRVEPNGAVARLFTKDVRVPAHGPDARKSSRRTIDECGFRSTFDLLEHFNSIAKARGVLDLRFAGTGEIDGRPTYVIVRDLPYEGPEGPYPDARMVLHLDQEWLLPVAVFSYADHQESELLGSYVFTNIELNPAFDENSFRF